MCVYVCVVVSNLSTCQKCHTWCCPHRRLCWWAVHVYDAVTARLCVRKSFLSLTGLSVQCRNAPSSLAHGLVNKKNTFVLWRNDLSQRHFTDAECSHSHTHTN